MEGIDFKRNGLEILKKYRYVMLIFLAGLILMLIPSPDSRKKTEAPAQIQHEEANLQSQLGAILCKIDGAGDIEVLLTEASGSQTYYQADERISAGESIRDQHKDTVIITDSSRDQNGLIRRVDPPVYQGAIILCQGAKDANVRLAIVEAVSNATGLTSDKITVLKMK